MVDARPKRTRSFYAASPSPAPRSHRQPRSAAAAASSAQRQSSRSRNSRAVHPPAQRHVQKPVRAHAQARADPPKRNAIAATPKRQADKSRPERRRHALLRWFPCLAPDVELSPERQSAVFMMMTKRITGAHFAASSADQTLLSVCAALKRLSREAAVAAGADSTGMSLDTLEIARTIAALAKTSVDATDARLDLRTVPVSAQADQAEMLDERAYRRAIQRLSVQLRELEQVSEEVLGSPPMVTFRSLPARLQQQHPPESAENALVELRRTKSLPALPDESPDLDSLERAVNEWVDVLSSPRAMDTSLTTVSQDYSILRSALMRQSVLDPIAEEDILDLSVSSSPPRPLKRTQHQLEPVQPPSPSKRVMSIEDALIPLQRLISARTLESQLASGTSRPTLKTPSRVAMAERAKKRREQRLEAEMADRRHRRGLEESVPETQPLRARRENRLPEDRFERALPPLPPAATVTLAGRSDGTTPWDCSSTKGDFSTARPGELERSHVFTSWLHTPPLLSSRVTTSSKSEVTHTSQLSPGAKRRRRQGVLIDPNSFTPLQLAFLGNKSQNSLPVPTVF